MIDLFLLFLIALKIGQIGIEFRFYNARIMVIEPDLGEFIRVCYNELVLTYIFYSFIRPVSDYSKYSSIYIIQKFSDVHTHDNVIMLYTRFLTSIPPTTMCFAAELKAVHPH